MRLDEEKTFDALFSLSWDDEGTSVWDKVSRLRISTILYIYIIT